MMIIRQLIKFGMVGISNTIVGYLIYVASLKVIRFYGVCLLYDIYVAQFIMFVISVAWAFYWNNKCVFKENKVSKSNYICALLKTYVSYAFTSLFLSGLLLTLWIKYFNMNEFYAPILNLIITVPLNFFVQKYWVYCERHINKRQKIRRKIDESDKEYI